MNSKVNPEDFIFKMAELSHNVFESSINLMTEEDLQTINKIVVEAKKVSQFGVSLELLENREQDNIELNIVLESLRRVAEYSSDIEEVAINMNVNKSEPQVFNIQMRI